MRAGWPGNTIVKRNPDGTAAVVRTRVTVFAKDTVVPIAGNTIWATRTGAATLGNPFTTLLGVPPIFFCNPGQYDVKLEDADDVTNTVTIPWEAVPGDDIPGGLILPDSLTTAEIGPNAVGSSEIAADSVGDSELDAPVENVIKRWIPFASRRLERGGSTVAWNMEAAGAGSGLNLDITGEGISAGRARVIALKPASFALTGRTLKGRLRGLWISGNAGSPAGNGIRFSLFAVAPQPLNAGPPAVDVWTEIPAARLDTNIPAGAGATNGEVIGPTFDFPASVTGVANITEWIVGLTSQGAQFTVGPFLANCWLDIAHV